MDTLEIFMWVVQGTDLAMKALLVLFFINLGLLIVEEFND